MKTLTTLLIAVTASVSLNVNANELYNDPGIDDVFPMNAVTIQEQNVTFVEDTGQQVWSVEYEQWVNPADFNSTNKETLAGIEKELETNPPAAGKSSNSVFIWDEMAGEYQLN